MCSLYETKQQTTDSFTLGYNMQAHSHSMVRHELATWTKTSGDRSAVGDPSDGSSFTVH